MATDGGLEIISFSITHPLQSFRAGQTSKIANMQRTGKPLNTEILTVGTGIRNNLP